MTRQEEIMDRVAMVFPSLNMGKNYDASIRAYEYSFSNDVVEGHIPFVLIGKKVDADYLETEESFIKGMLDLHFKGGCRHSLYLLYGFKKMNGGQRVLLGGGVYPNFQ